MHLKKKNVASGYDSSHVLAFPLCLGQLKRTLSNYCTGPNCMHNEFKCI